MKWLLAYLSTRKCNGRCGDPSFHTAHLTWIGKRRFT